MKPPKKHRRHHASRYDDDSSVNSSDIYGEEETSDECDTNNPPSSSQIILRPRRKRFKLKVSEDSDTQSLESAQPGNLGKIRNTRSQSVSSQEDTRSDAVKTPVISPTNLVSDNEEPLDLTTPKKVKQVKFKRNLVNNIQKEIAKPGSSLSHQKSGECFPTRNRSKGRRAKGVKESSSPTLTSSSEVSTDLKVNKSKQSHSKCVEGEKQTINRTRDPAMNKDTSKQPHSQHIKGHRLLKKRRLSKESSPPNASGAIPVMCDICGREFPTASDMSRHYKVVHLDHKFQCDLCDNTFKTFQNLHKHTQEFHVVPQTHISCSVCSDVFKNLADLNIHMACHGSEPQTGCNSSNGSIVRRKKQQCISNETLNDANAELHPKLSLQTTQNQIFSCPSCERKFGTKQLLISHIQTGCLNDSVQTKKGSYDISYCETEDLNQEQTRKLEFKLNSIELKPNKPRSEDDKPQTTRSKVRINDNRQPATDHEDCNELPTLKITRRRQRKVISPTPSTSNSEISPEVSRKYQAKNRSLANKKKVTQKSKTKMLQLTRTPTMKKDVRYLQGDVIITPGGSSMPRRVMLTPGGTAKPVNQTTDNIHTPEDSLNQTSIGRANQILKGKIGDTNRNQTGIPGAIIQTPKGRGTAASLIRRADKFSEKSQSSLQGHQTNERHNVQQLQPQSNFMQTFPAENMSSKLPPLQSFCKTFSYKKGNNESVLDSNMIIQRQQHNISIQNTRSDLSKQTCHNGKIQNTTTAELSSDNFLLSVSYVCGCCDTEFSDIHELHTHEQRHEEDGTLMCKECGFEAAQLRLMYLHIGQKRKCPEITNCSVNEENVNKINIINETNDNVYQRNIPGENQKSVNIDNATNQRSVNIGNSMNQRSVHIDNAINQRSVHIDNATLQRSVNIDNAVNQRSVNIDNAINQRSVHIDNATLQRSVNIDNAVNQRSVNIDNAVNQRSVNQRSVNIDNAVNQRSVNIDNAVNQRSVNIDNAINQRNENIDNATNQRNENIDNAVHQRSMNMNSDMCQQNSNTEVNARTYEPVSSVPGNRGHFSVQEQETLSAMQQDNLCGPNQKVHGQNVSKPHTLHNSDENQPINIEGQSLHQDQNYNIHGQNGSFFSQLLTVSSPIKLSTNVNSVHSGSQQPNNQLQDSHLKVENNKMMSSTVNQNNKMMSSTVHQNNKMMSSTVNQNNKMMSSTGNQNNKMVSSTGNQENKMMSSTGNQNYKMIRKRNPSKGPKIPLPKGDDFIMGHYKMEKNVLQKYDKPKKMYENFNKFMSVHPGFAKDLKRNPMQKRSRGRPPRSVTTKNTCSDSSNITQPDEFSDIVQQQSNEHNAETHNVCSSTHQQPLSEAVTIVVDDSNSSSGVPSTQIIPHTTAVAALGNFSNATVFSSKNVSCYPDCNNQRTNAAASFSSVILASDLNDGSEHEYTTNQHSKVEHPLPKSYVNFSKDNNFIEDAEEFDPSQSLYSQSPIKLTNRTAVEVNTNIATGPLSLVPYNMSSDEDNESETEEELPKPVNHEHILSQPNSKTNERVETEQPLLLSQQLQQLASTGPVINIDTYTQQTAPSYEAKDEQKTLEYKSTWKLPNSAKSNIDENEEMINSVEIESATLDESTTNSYESEHERSNEEDEMNDRTHYKENTESVNAEFAEQVDTSQPDESGSKTTIVNVIDNSNQEQFLGEIEEHLSSLKQEHVVDDSSKMMKYCADSELHRRHNGKIDADSNQWIESDSGRSLTPEMHENRYNMDEEMSEEELCLQLSDCEEEGYCVSSQVLNVTDESPAVVSVKDQPCSVTQENMSQICSYGTQNLPVGRHQCTKLNDKLNVDKNSVPTVNDEVTNSCVKSESITVVNCGNTDTDQTESCVESSICVHDEFVEKVDCANDDSDESIDCVYDAEAGSSECLHDDVRPDNEQDDSVESSDNTLNDVVQHSDCEHNDVDSKIHASQVSEINVIPREQDLKELRNPPISSHVSSNTLSGTEASVSNKSLKLRNKVKPVDIRSKLYRETVKAHAVTGRDQGSGLTEGTTVTLVQANKLKNALYSTDTFNKTTLGTVGKGKEMMENCENNLLLCEKNIDETIVKSNNNVLVKYQENISRLGIHMLNANVYDNHNKVPIFEDSYENHNNLNAKGDIRFKTRISSSYLHRENNNKIEYLFPCKYCDVSFMFPRELQKHGQENHQGQPVLNTAQILDTINGWKHTVFA